MIIRSNEFTRIIRFINSVSSNGAPPGWTPEALQEMKKAVASVARDLELQERQALNANALAKMVERLGGPASQYFGILHIKED